MRTTILTTVTILMAVSTLVTSADERRIPTLKIGKCVITLLDSNGIKPLDGAKLELKQAENGKTSVSAVANKSGLCEITVAEGRYILSINEKPITLVNATKDGALAWARIVVSPSPMMIGGQEESVEATSSFMGLGVPGLAAAAAGGGLLIGSGVSATADLDKDDRSDNTTTTVPPPPRLARDDDDEAPSASN